MTDYAPRISQVERNMIRNGAMEFAQRNPYPGTTATAANDRDGAIQFIGSDTANAYGSARFPVAMRTNPPAITIYGPTGTAGGYHTVGIGDQTGAGVAMASSTGFTKITKAAGFASGGVYLTHFAASADF